MNEQPLQHAADWLDKHASFRRMIGLTALRKALGRVSGQCTWCGGEVGSGRRRWCCQECRDAALLRCDRNAIAGHVWRRDRGVCAECGIDTNEISKRLERLRSRAVASKRGYTFARWRRLKQAFTGGSGLHFWEADHIVPVIEGGGCKGPENYRTLCIRCHKAETKKLAARRAQKRRDEKRPLLTDTAE